MSDIRAYWWEPENRKSINLGDHINKVILETLSGKNVIHSERNDCDIIAVGSILWKGVKKNGQTRKLHVWGSGLMTHWDYKSADAYENVEYCAVRGNFTSTIIGLPDSLPKGDPGILLSDILPMGTGKRYKYGIIPHHKNMHDENILMLKETLPLSVIINFKDPDYKRTLQTMNSCEFIVSSAMHGLIIADSYGIPNAWVHTNEIHRGNRFKFYDYFSSIGRVDRQVNAQAWQKNSFSDEIFSDSYFTNVPACKAGLIASFPKF